MLLISSTALSINTDQWLVQKLHVEDGLPSSTIFSVQQDSDGFLWFGTVNGLARYDGYDFKIYQHDGADLTSISNNNSGNLFIDSKNILWIGTFGGGFNTINLNTGVLTRFPYSSNKNDLLVSEFVQTFYEDQHSNIWIGTPNGLYKYTDKIVKHYKHDEKIKNSLIHSRVWDILEGPSGNIWIATTQGLSKLNPNNDSIDNFQLPNELVDEISSNEFRKLYLHNNTLWIGSSSALHEFDIETNKFKSHPLKYSIKINDLMLVEDVFFVATMGGLYHFDIIKKEFVKDQKNELLKTLSNNDLRYIFVDSSGLLWFTTLNSGVFKIDPTGGQFKKNKILDSNDNELSQRVWSIEFDEDNNTYIGTSDTLFIKSNDNHYTRIVTNGKNQIPGRIRSLKRSKNNDMWIGSSDGLFVLPKGETVAQAVNEPFEIIGTKPLDIFSIEETQSGDFWFSLDNLGIMYWSPKENKAYILQKYQDTVLTELKINTILQDSKDNIWITTNLAGLIKFDIKNNKITIMNHDPSNKNSISSNRVSDILEDSQGRLWIATSKGVNLYDPILNSFQIIRSAEGLVDESLFSILKDSQNNIWVSHFFGISRINNAFDEVQNFKINSNIRKDGLRIRAANINKSDELYYGSNNGLYTFDPKKLQSCIQFEPNLQLTKVNINNIPLSSEELIQKNNYFDLYHLDRVIFFEFSVTEFNSPDHVKYSYRVSELSDNWHDVTDTRNMEFSSLKPGNYTLEIKANNSDCRWSEKRLNVSIIVHPEWWNLWWVRILFIISVISITFFYNYFKSKIIRKRNFDLEALVKNRTSELMLLNKKLESASQTDFLTGLKNRAGFFNSFEKLNTDIGCIVLADIDHFKIINDEYGHLAGDKILKDIAKIIIDNIKYQGIVARWGGEEFIFYFHDKNSSETYRIVEGIRVEIERAKFVFDSYQINVTCTFGICQNHPSMNINDCIKSADKSLYIGKSKGRNTSVISPIIETNGI
ncbi:MAG: two-component regulator propeller domain-containing protein [Marinicellaceae bacterium]